MTTHKKKRGRGKKTFFFLLLTKGKWYLLFAAGLLYIAYQINYGSLREPAVKYLASSFNGYISVELLSLWFLSAGIGLLIISYALTRYYYKHIRFIIDEHAFTLLRGIYFTHETTIPYHQITNVHIYRPYHYKILGVAKLDVVTAADRSMENLENKAKKYLVPVIDGSEARKLSRYLLKKAAESRGEDVEEIEEEINVETGEIEENTPQEQP